MRPLYGTDDLQRPVPDLKEDGSEPFRTAWRRDYARLIHSPSFRRLQGKTQVFPGYESDFYRNRLTHSIEVAQIAKAMAIRLNAIASEFSELDQKIEPDIVEFAALAHDLGHPPFGHNGEEALDECMMEYGGFEGNAQSLRIVSRLEKKVTLSTGDEEFKTFDGTHDLRRGLNVTYRSMAALLKYDLPIPERGDDRAEKKVVKGYYTEDNDLVSSIKKHVLGVEDYTGEFKTIECSIMDIADDVAYSTYDLEDNFKAGFLSPMGLFALDEEVYAAVAETIQNRVRKQYPEAVENPPVWLFPIDADSIRYYLLRIFEYFLFDVSERPVNIQDDAYGRAVKKMLTAAEVQALSRKISSDGYRRTGFTSTLVQRFLEGVIVSPNPTFSQLHQAKLSLKTFIYVEVLKNITYHAIIRSPGLQVVEYRGKDIVRDIFKALREKGGDRLLPADFRAICQGAPTMVRMRAICDFIAGMTDRYAFEFYSRLYGANNLTVHKPF